MVEFLGLTCAFWLKEYGHHVKVFEKEPSVGGWVKSRRTVNGSIMDLAANGWLDNEPAVHRLIDALDAHQEHIPVSDPQSTRWIVFQDKLVPAPLSPPMLLRTPLLSFGQNFDCFSNPLSLPNHHQTRVWLNSLNGGWVLVSSKDFSHQWSRAFMQQTLQNLMCKVLFFQTRRLGGSIYILFAALRSPKRPKSKQPVLHTFRGGAGAICEMLARRISEENIVFEKIEALEKKKVTGFFRVNIKIIPEFGSCCVGLSCLYPKPTSTKYR